MRRGRQQGKHAEGGGMRDEEAPSIEAEFTNHDSRRRVGSARVRLRAESAKWAKVVRGAGIQPE